MNIMAPQDFELRWLRFERRATAWLQARFDLAALLMLAVTIGLAFATEARLHDGSSYRLLNGFKNFYVFSYSMIAILALAMVGVYLPGRHLGWYRILSSVAIWAIFVSMFARTLEVLVENAVLFMFVPALYVLALVFIRVKKQFRRFEPLIALFGLSFWVMYAYVYLHRADYSADVLGFFWELKLPFFWLFVSYGYLAKDAYTSTTFLFNPAHVTRGVLWPGHIHQFESDLERRGLWIYGLWNLILAYLVLNLRMDFESWIEIEGLGTYSRSAFVIILRLLTDIGICNILTGFARIFGFRVPDATHFVLLAKTPAEYWRRGSVYTFQFVLRFIYLPIARTSKNRLVAVFFGFLFFYLNRTGFAEFVAIGDQVLHDGGRFLSQVSQQTKANTIIFLFYFLSIVVSQKFWFISRAKLDRPLAAWTSILLTHLTNISIVALARYLVEAR